MKKRLFLLVCSLTSFVIATFLLHTVPAHAVFNANNLIIDGVFDNSNSMNAAQIDAWLNTNFPSSCISTNKGFYAPDPNGYSPSTKFTYGSNVSAGTIIYHASQAYDLNPQVILATLQKEQSLVAGEAGCSKLRYVGAMGNGCPDSGPPGGYTYSGFVLYSLNGVNVTDVSGTCVNSAMAAGFSQQVITATWKLKFWEQRSEGNVGWNIQKPGWDNSDDPTTCYIHKMTQGNFKRCIGDAAPTYFDGLYTIDNTSVHMDNGATAALYTYTPHFSGNQNFSNIFTNWFGSPTLGCGSNETMMPQVVSMYNPKTYDHFYTAYRCEANILGFQQGYTYEGAVFNTTDSSAPEAVPVWRLYYPALGFHLWTTSQDDINNAAKLGYNVEGVAFYAAPPNAPNVSLVHRLYNPKTYQHFWAMSQDVINLATQSAGYKYEGPSFYSQ